MLEISKNLRFAKKQFEVLKKIAKDKKITVSKIIRKFIDTGINKKEKK